MITAGDLFPDFSVLDQEGTIHTLSALKGHRLILFCYPKDDTSGCTQEACEFRDTLPQFGDVKVLGISPDPVKSHSKFAGKHSLPYPLLSDPDQALLLPLGVWVEKSMYGRKYMGVERTTFLVDAEGKVERIWTKVKPAGHAADVLKALRAI